MNPSDANSRYDRVIDLIEVPATKIMTLAGLGSMGNPVGTQLARHGVGTRPPGRIRLIDGDLVEARNLIGTDYRHSHIGRPKAQVTAEILREINPDVNVSFQNKMLTESDIPAIVSLARQSDLLCHFYDSFDLALKVAEACDGICPQVTAFFGPQCNYAEVAFSVPGVTQSLARTLGQRKLSSISKPQALGVDTQFVSSFVAALCLRLMLGNARGRELFACYANAPLYVVSVRPDWIFTRQSKDIVRSVLCVGAPRSV